jgi:hypothetical protein
MFLRSRGRFSSQSNIFFDRAAALVLECKSENEIPGIVMACVLLVSASNDAKYGKGISGISAVKI